MLAGDEVRAAFEAAIDEREAAGHVLDNRLVAIERAAIEDARLDGKVAEIEVRFDAFVAAVTRDKDGELVAGSMSDAVPTNDIWTFQRDLDEPATPTGASSRPTKPPERRRDEPRSFLPCWPSWRWPAARARSRRRAPRRPSAPRPCRRPPPPLPTPPPAPVAAPPARWRDGARGRRARRAAATRARSGAGGARLCRLPDLLPVAAHAAADVSGLTRPEDWREACAGPRRPVAGGAAAFFARAVRAGPGRRRRRLRDRLLRARDPGLADAGSRAMRCRSMPRPPDLLDANPATGSAGQGPGRRERQLRPLSRPRPRSRRARSPGAGSRSPGRPIRSTSSSCRSRARGGCGCPTAR